MFTLDKLRIVGIIQRKKYVNDVPYKILIIYSHRHRYFLTSKKQSAYFTQYIIPHKTQDNT